MKIAKVDVFAVRAPRKEAVRSGTTTTGGVTASEFGIIRLESDTGTEGLGEISITYPRIGFSLCHAIRTSKEFESARDTPVIFVSAVRQIAGSRFGFKGEDQGLTGPEDYIDKPVNPAHLLARIELFLKK